MQNSFIWFDLLHGRVKGDFPLAFSFSENQLIRKFRPFFPPCTTPSTHDMLVFSVTQPKINFIDRFHFALTLVFKKFIHFVENYPKKKGGQRCKFWLTENEATFVALQKEFRKSKKLKKWPTQFVLIENTSLFGFQAVRTSKSQGCVFRFIGQDVCLLVLKLVFEARTYVHGIHVRKTYVLIDKLNP